MNKSIRASILVAVAASLCCTGPLLLLLLGSTTFGIFSIFEHVRPFTSLLAVGILAYAYFKLFISKAGQDCCALDNQIAIKKYKKQKRLLLMVTPIVIGLLILPFYIGNINGHKIPMVVKDGHFISEWKIDGMTCEGCARGLEGGLAAIKGITACEVDYSGESMLCHIDRTILSLDKIPGLVKKMGYKAYQKLKDVGKRTTVNHVIGSNPHAENSNSRTYTTPLRVLNG